MSINIASIAYKVQGVLVQSILQIVGGRFFYAEFNAKSCPHINTYSILLICIADYVQYTMYAPKLCTWQKRGCNINMHDSLCVCRCRCRTLCNALANCPSRISLARGCGLYLSGIAVSATPTACQHSPRLHTKTLPPHTMRPLFSIALRVETIQCRSSMCECVQFIEWRSCHGLGRTHRVAQTHTHTHRMETVELTYRAQSPCKCLHCESVLICADDDDDDVSYTQFFYLST